MALHKHRTDHERRRKGKKMGGREEGREGRRVPGRKDGRSKGGNYWLVTSLPLLAVTASINWISFILMRAGLL